jgi:hypothetical protein
VIRLSPMAESRLYKIAQPRNLLRSELHCLIQTGPSATDHDITESDQRVIFPTPPIAQKLSEHLGKQFYVENISGANGNVGMGRAAKSAAAQKS